MDELDFHLDSYPNKQDAINALEAYVATEVEAHIDGFRSQGFDHAYAYIEKCTYKDGEFEEVCPGYVKCIDYYEL